METEKLNYSLPPELIAQKPVDIRSGSRLLVLNRAGGALLDSQFAQIGRFLRPGDCLVLNDTKVIPAKFFAHRVSGGKLQGLFLAEDTPGLWKVMLKGAGRLKTGETIYLNEPGKKDFCQAEVLGRLGQGRWLLQINQPADAQSILNKIGFAPLPPYIKRRGNNNTAEADKERYQTVYARAAGAVAAPTAGLHFTDELIDQLKNKGVCFAYLTLHVGAGTFKPITAKNLDDHQIHQERFSLDEENARIINTAKEKANRIIAVGTTTVRTLETTVQDRKVKAKTGATRLFIKPGYKFKIVDTMITNFHLPKSSLLALVATFAGVENILSAYQHAIEQRYRFYSYGDAMLII